MEMRYTLTPMGEQVYGTHGMPCYATEGAAAIDLRNCSGKSYHLDGHQRVIVPTGICCAIPKGYVGLLTIRSGLGARGFSLGNGVGVIDSDYRGEIGAIIHGHGAIREGERVAQLAIIPVAQVELVKVASLDATDRGAGGYGSTGRI